MTLVGRANAATYYVSGRGDDTRPGTSPDTAWRTLTKVNNVQLVPGDTVMLEGGATFEGPLVPPGAGRPGAPVTYSSYGDGRATISSSSNNIVFLHSANWVTIQNLVLTANGAGMHVVVSDPATTSSFVTDRKSVV